MISLFEVHSVLKSFISNGFYPCTKCSCRVLIKISNKFHQGTITTIMFSAGIALKLDQTFPSFNSLSSFLSVTTDGRKQLTYI